MHSIQGSHPDGPRVLPPRRGRQLVEFPARQVRDVPRPARSGGVPHRLHPQRLVTREPRSRWPLSQSRRPEVRRLPDLLRSQPARGSVLFLVRQQRPASRLREGFGYCQRTAPRGCGGASIPSRRPRGSQRHSRLLLRDRALRPGTRRDPFVLGRARPAGEHHRHRHQRQRDAVSACQGGSIRLRGARAACRAVARECPRGTSGHRLCQLGRHSPNHP